MTAAEPGRLSVALLTGSIRPRSTAAPACTSEYLARELAPLVRLTVHCQGADRPGAVAHRAWDQLAGANQALQTVSADLSMTAAVAAPTWSTPTPGTRTWPVTWPRCSTASRT